MFCDRFFGFVLDCVSIRVYYVTHKQYTFNPKALDSEMTKKRINISIPEEVLKKLDKLKQEKGTSRSDVLAQAVNMLYDLTMTGDLWRGEKGYRITLIHPKSENGKLPVIVSPQNEARTIKEIFNASKN